MLNGNLVSAINVIEGFEKGDNAEAWGLVIKSGVWQHLQGFYQRTVCQLLSDGIFDEEGNYYGDSNND